MQLEKKFDFDQEETSQAEKLTSIKLDEEAQKIKASSKSYV